MKAGGVYQWLDNGGSGKYSYNAGTYKINWIGGHLADLDADTEFGLDGADPEITITIKTPSGNIEWQCDMES